MDDCVSKSLEEGSVQLSPAPGTTEHRGSAVGLAASSSCSSGRGAGETAVETSPATVEQGSRRNRGRRRHTSLYSERAGYKRRAGQDMTRPLKMWLYENRGNPYPSKEEKTALAMDSEMTLVQVSNWFANARRRLKNSVRQPGLPWSKRIKLCNVHAADTADRLSATSSVSDRDLELNTEEADQATLNDPSTVESRKNFDSVPRTPSTTANEETLCPQFLPPPPIVDEYQSQTANLHKLTFKQSILHRYLNDSIQHRRAEYQPLFRHHHHRVRERTPPPVRSSDSGSMSSHDYEDVSCSPNGAESGGNQPVFPDTHTGVTDNYLPCRPNLAPVSATIHGDVLYQANDADETYWKDMTAAMILTNMARAKRQQKLLQR